MLSGLFFAFLALKISIFASFISKTTVPSSGTEGYFPVSYIA
jgi:hypothetical protein